MGYGFFLVLVGAGREEIKKVWIHGSQGVLFHPILSVSCGVARFILLAPYPLGW
jgi:hypothetical protein